MSVFGQYGDKSKMFPNYTLKWVKVNDKWYVEIVQEGYETLACNQEEICEEIDELESNDDYDLARWQVLQKAFVFSVRHQWR